ncbi:hypothetical protein C7S15_0990 [Burkholderia cepacia]|nr:hypothetical protein [Burkholderia cepacia]
MRSGRCASRCRTPRGWLRAIAPAVAPRLPLFPRYALRWRAPVFPRRRPAGGVSNMRRTVLRWQGE